jgi:NADPH-dependent glutamate synthase beta subunit-like oxidoreductase
MDRRELEAISSHCTQEDPPACQTACPLRVDARAFLERMAAGDMAGGRKILERAMPLPAILARICDHPCETACPRSRLGGALAVGALERACILAAGAGAKPLVLPRKAGKAAILGGGLGALTVAWDLTRKGYAVTLYAAGDAPGGNLAVLPEAVLPAGVLAGEIARLVGLGLRLEIGQRLDAARLEAACRDHGAVYVAAGKVDALPDFRDGTWIS